MKNWKEKTDVTFGIVEKVWVLSGRCSPDSRWRRFINVTAVRKSDRSLIDAFLSDLISVRYQFF